MTLVADDDEAAKKQQKRNRRKVHVVGGLGNIFARNLMRTGDTYSRSAGNDHTVTLEISRGMGSIRLEQSEE